MARLDERPGFYVAFLALVEHPEGGRRQDAKRPEKRGARGPLAPGPALQLVEKVQQKLGFFVYKR